MQGRSPPNAYRRRPETQTSRWEGSRGVSFFGMLCGLAASPVFGGRSTLLGGHLRKAGGSPRGVTVGLSTVPEELVPDIAIGCLGVGL